MRVPMLFVVAIGCSSSNTPAPAAPPPATPVAAVDAAPPAPPDADVPEAVASAPAWVFRYSAPNRVETWTLRHAGDKALVVVEAANGTARYIGSAADGASLKLDVLAGSNKLVLDCKRAQRAIGTKCNDTKAKKLDVLDCFHPDFKEPMTFGPAPGIEFVTSDSCNGYRLIGN